MIEGREGSSARRARRVVAWCLLLALLPLGCLRSRLEPEEPDLVREGLPADVAAAVDVVDRLHETMIGIMEQGPELGFDGRYRAMEAIARESFDIPVMARASFGPGWADLTAEQRRAWLDAYERFHISSVADFRDRYQGQVYRILDYARLGPGLVLVMAKLDFPGRNVDLYMDYRMRQTRDGWRIIDLHEPPTVSEVGMRRAEYRTVMERHGFEGLLQEMEMRIARRKQP